MNSMASILRPYLELIRLPAVFTAPADVLMGAALIASVGITVSMGSLLLLVGASALVYCAGMAANDLQDRDIDGIERPDRPIPSGRITSRSAWILVIVCQAGGLALASGVGMIPAVAVGATIALTYLYNSPIKGSIFGPLIMGACRYGNGCVGLSIAGPDITGHGSLFFVPILVAAYVVILTSISRYETEGDDTGQVYRLLVLQLIVAFGPAASVFGLGSVEPWHAIFACLTPLWLLPNLLKSRGVLGAGQIRGSVMRGIMGIAILNAALAASVGEYGLALVIAGLLVPGRFVGRWFYAT